MKRWLGAALLGCAGAVALTLWLAPGAAPVRQPAPAQAVQTPELVPPAPVVAAPAAAKAPATVSAAAEQPPAEAPLPPGLDPLEAQLLMQLMLERGDPRSPALGELEPRPTPSPAVLADPAQYQAFEDQHSRAQIQAYVGGVQQIPAIRERIEQAAQSGERNAAELDEARAALEQLEMLQRKLQREAPELLQGVP
ncbi:hypothetical protein LPB260_20030 [Pseudomonas sp. LPB0260]|uniref:hypothetical protein n=1 Tax=Pseudomonas sp. LPB0260 TaxID=2614442 RepID=UPI0015C22B35|nr:hypothetical protein [Pseudomonas sp. LPB0260]QLC73041.1 hypothetical protein LPB260_05080 [Pseudomonas sp. LPB0260]QLC75815.1 hypothetical protein LPB260_20030 [Pseudomonas sp. LPB0260]